MVERVAGLGLSGRVLLSSFNHLSLLEARTLDAAIETAAILYGRMAEPWDYALRHGFQAIHPIHQAVTGELVERCHAAGLAVRPWTLDEAEPARRMQALGVDAIITDMPRQAREWCAGGAARTG